MKKYKASRKWIMRFIGRREMKLFITFLIFYFYFINWYGWNEESNFSLTRAIVEENRFEIDSFSNLTGDRSVYKSHYYSDKSPGMSFLAAPVYAVWKFVYYNLLPESFSKAYAGSAEFITTFHNEAVFHTYVDPGFFTLNSMLLITALTSSVFTALTAVLIYRLSKKITRNEKYRLAATVAYALGTLAFPYALHFMSHATSAFFAFLAFYILFKMRLSKRAPNSQFIDMRFLLAGLAIGFASTVEYIIIITIPLFLVYALSLSMARSHKRGFVLFFFALILGLMPLAVYNYTILGNPFDILGSYIDREIYRTAYRETPFDFTSLAIIKNFQKLINPNVYKAREFVEQSFFSSLFSSLSPSFEWVFEHFHLIPPNPYILVRLLLYPYRGLLFYSPILLLSFIGLYWMFKKHKLEVVIVVLTLALFLIIVSMRSGWWGGYCFGNRYLTPVVPFLIVPMLYAFNKIKSKAFLAIVLSLIIVSVFINFLGLQSAENRAYDWGIMMMNQQWFEKQDSFEIFYNPLTEHYWPGFLDKGPRSPLFENIVNGYISIDIRTPALSKGVQFPFSDFYVPFLNIIPLIVIVSLVWIKELKTSFENLCKRLRK